MIVIDIKKIVEESLHHGVELKTVVGSLHSLARRHMIRDFNGLLRSLHLPSSMTREEFMKLYKADEKLRKSFKDVRVNHVYGYLGEMAVHHALGRDWRLVFRFNRIGVYNMEDGFVDGYSYDVKARHKNRKGLSVQVDKVRCCYYVLGHFIGGRAHMMGYAERADLLARKPRRDKYGNVYLSIAAKKLPHSFDDFVRRFKDH